MLTSAVVFADAGFVLQFNGLSVGGGESLAFLVIARQIVAARQRRRALLQD